MANLDRKIFTISGIKVMFPCKPYPSQFGMMDRVIKGLERKQNSLLESPTGSGKSLALLCSALAWQCTMNERLTKESMQSAAEASCSKQCTCGAADQAKKMQEYSPGSKPVPESQADGGRDKPIEVDSDEDDDFKPTGKFRTPTPGQGPGNKRGHIQIEYEKDPPPAHEAEPLCTCNKDSRTTSKKKIKLPKIFFCTRTHKQIAQIARELGKTEYHDVRMGILASREHCCIHPEVSRMKKKSEGCRERLDGPGCKFNERAKRVFVSQNHLQEALPTAWDLEDLVSACRVKKACPYFVTRNIIDQADIIFCPYNYLIDPLVRNSMEINLKDQIVILDEAHNIEDSARDAASGSLTTEQINMAIQDLQEMLNHNVKFADHLAWKNMMERLSSFIEESDSLLQQLDYDTAYKVWEGFDIVARLKNIGLGPDQFHEYQQKLERISASDEDQQEIIKNRYNQEVKLHISTLKLLELLVQILDYMYRDDMKFVEDYRVAIMRSMQFVPNRDTNNTWMSKNRRGGSRVMVFTLNFWCMNPAVAFSDFSCCRSIVLSSGTLSPMSTFASELGVQFPIQLEANHVIEDKQVWVGTVGRGPNGGLLEAVYKNKETYSFQDELGNLILKVCTTVPHGVLCFLPSYRDVEKFVQRWKVTNLWGRIALRKRIMVEPRAVDKEDFDCMMKAFYDVVKGNTCSDFLDGDDMYGDDSDIDGALFIAVCRGKVSEGMDFADNNARAVITIGIPFPSIKDLQITLKKAYNDKHRASRGLLSGNEWYEIQAFRALNQALGRCIRHRKDWGALIVVDDRFVKKPDKYCKGLSKWVRSKVVAYEHFGIVEKSLLAFTEKMIKEMPVVNPDTSFIPCTPCTPGTSRRDSIYRTQPLDTSILNSSVTDMNQSIVFSPKQNLDKTLEIPVHLLNQTDHLTPLKPQCLAKYAPPGQNTSPPVGDVPQSSADKPDSNETEPTHSKKTKMSPTCDDEPPSKGTCLIKMEPATTKMMALPSADKPVTQRTLTKPVTGAKLPPSVFVPSGKAASPTKLVLPPSSTSLSIQEQLVEAINSGKVPKDRPCLLIMNQGKPEEMTLLIEPNKVGKQELTKAMKRETDTVEKQEHSKAGKELLVERQTTSALNISTPSKKPEAAPQQPQISPPDTEPVTSRSSSTVSPGVAAPVTQATVLNGGDPATSSHAETSVAKVKTEKQTTPEKLEEIFTLPTSDKNKFLKFVKVSKTPTTPRQPLVSLITSKIVSPRVAAPVYQGLVLKGAKSEKPVAQVKTETQTTPEKSNEIITGYSPDKNKFLKFIKVPTTLAAKVPVAMVIPQKVESTKKEPVNECPAVQRGATREAKPQGSSDSDVDRDRTSPILFYNALTVAESESENESDPSAGGTEVEGSKARRKRKPLFKKDRKDVRRNSVGCETRSGKGRRKSEGSSCQGYSDGIEKNNDQDQKSYEKDSTSEINSDRNVDGKGRRKSEGSSHQDPGGGNEKSGDLDPNKSHGKSSTRGGISCSILSQLKQFRRSSVDEPDEKNLKELKSPVEKVTENKDIEILVDSDEEFLNTRRKGGRKRSKGQHKVGVKRIRRPVYDAGEEEISKENKGTSKAVRCLKCGINWLIDEEFEKVWKPEFLECANQDVLSLYCREGKMHSLQPHFNDSEGTQLNSFYDMERKCCVQYLQCKNCGKSSRIVGARVVMADPMSEFKPGQTWILSSATKT